MQANGGLANQPAVAQNVNPQAVAAAPFNEQGPHAQPDEIADQDVFALDLLHQEPPPPAPFVPGADDQYEDPGPPIEFLE